MAIVLVVLVVIVIVVAVLFVSIYNNLVTLRANREQAFADIDVKIKQRYDLVTNLVNTVK
jgi:LemA protein